MTPATAMVAPVARQVRDPVGPPAMTPLAVVHLAGSAEWAGGERYLELLARHLDRRRVRLAVVAPAEGPLRAALEALEVPVHVVDLERRLVRPGAIGELARLLRRLSADIVQSHGARSNFYARLAGARAGVPVLCTVHNSLRDYPVRAARRALYLAMDRLTLPLAAGILCVAAGLAREYGRRARVIPNGVDLAEFDPAAVSGPATRQALGLGAGPVVGFVGRLTEQKDPLAFVRAVAAVAADVPGLQALVVGDGPLRPALLAEAARCGVAGAFRLAGVRRDVPALLAAMDVLLLPSRSEGFPFAVLEAMAMERAVVATAVNGVPELVEDGVTGVVVPPGDAPALARAAGALLADGPRARALGRAARRRVAERFTVERMVAETEQLYRELARPPAGQPVARPL
jgi:glycosyltransferase involved in cell wall biosynthesis